MVSIDDIIGMNPAPEEDKPVELKPHFVRQKTGEKIYVNKDEFKIGKSKVHSDYSIENNTAISRVHVIVIHRDGDYYLKDNDSTNGTFVDGERLEPGREVLLKANMKLDQLCAISTETRADIKALNQSLIDMDKRLSSVEDGLKTAFHRIDELREELRHGMDKG